MSLIDQARATVRSILNDTSGFGIPVTVTSPDGISAVVHGLSTDIGLSIDPETGLTVSGRKASVTLSIEDLADAGMELPESVPDEDQKPWLVQFQPPTGAPVLMKVVDTIPDKLGLVVLHLGKYRTDLP